MLLSVVILAAGQGKRMNSDLPKVLQPLAGRPLLAHVLSTARSLEPANIVVVYGHGGAQVQAALPDEDVDWVLQAQQLGTGHALMQAMAIVPDDHRVLVLYGDVPLIRAQTLRSLLGTAGDPPGAPSPTPALALLSALAQDPTGYGRIVRDSANKVLAIIEHRDASSDQLAIREINTGVLAAPAKALREWLSALKNDNAQGEYLLTDVVAAAVQVGAQVGATVAGDASEVTGVNDKRQLAAVEAMYRKARADDLMRAGATLSDPARIDIRGEVSVERDVFIDVNAVMVGRVHLGARVKVGPNCYLRNATIGADTEIFANSLIDEVAVGENCRIGPFARLRPGSVLQNEVHIGNFVEVKNSRIGTGSKANHLTYLGDTRVGNEVNVGAGTITCNYDGLNKWPTVIEDGAFIGSGAMLVAPVRIGAKATIGAGSTITATAPDGKLTLTRARQTTMESWSRPDKLRPADKAAVIDRALQKPKDP
jgi:bifunctional UDP-N-acetylglucosamine pyrophosphorylase/glucosamine-1-phosphate N-acetyltransferase